MRNTRGTRSLIVGVGLAIAALTLAACGSGSGAADDATATSSGSVADDAADVRGDAAGGAAGIVESGSGGADPELVDVASPQGVLTEDGIAGKTFVVKSASGFTFVDPERMQFVFPTAAQISIIGGCNSLFGELRWDGAVVTAPALASTMMACDQPLMDQDQALSGLLADGVTASLDGDVLTLATEAVTIELQATTSPSEDEGAVGDLEQPIPSPGEVPASSGD